MKVSVTANARRQVRKFLPIIVVAAVLLVVVVSAYGASSTPKSSFSFGVYWPVPSQYTPNVISPNVLLQINYTGPSPGSFRYVISYNSTSGEIVAAQDSIEVSPSISFNAYVQLPIPRGGTVVVTAQVYDGSAGQHLAYRNSVTL
ncbi:MAG: hypothetical protein JRM88_06985 [Nitrososphaerota archaeon]|jgi:hypothetical protein|nr:hypothetical protein [Nitrososphaerota archaeon]